MVPVHGSVWRKGIVIGMLWCPEQDHQLRLVDERKPWAKHAVWMPPLSQTWMCVTAACPFSRGVHPTACIFLPSWWGGRAGELCAGILVQRNVFLHTQWLVMGTTRTTCNCSLERVLSLIMATCRSVEMVRLLWKYSISEGALSACCRPNTEQILS